jgi:hypothetical protein
MPAIGGSIELVRLQGRGFPVAADADSQRKYGGFQNEVQANGDASARLIKTRETWSITGLTVQIDDARADQEYLQDLANLPEFFSVAVTYASGVVLQGVGQIVDDLEASSQSATASLSLSGPGVLTKQVGGFV